MPVLSAPSAEEQAECASLLTNSVMFKYCSQEKLGNLCQNMEKAIYEKGELLLHQGEKSNRMFVIASGQVQRLREQNGQLHKVDTAKCGNTVGSLHLIREEPCYATAQAGNEVVAYTMDSAKLNSLLLGDPILATEVIYNLTKEVRTMTKQMKTPLLEQQAKQSSFLVVSIAASLESFYRSALNSLLNARLTGVRGSLFPNMHIQIPTRVVYINGIKGFRRYLENAKIAENSSNPDLTRMGVAIAPGLFMTPVSNILEASNAGHTNKEPIFRRSLRGTVPRAAREVIFGIGLNQLSDFCEERWTSRVESDWIANALGSMTAGMISGYISHVPHNLATMKLLYPDKSYLTHFKNLLGQSMAGNYVRQSLPQTGFYGVLGSIGATVATCLMPKGVAIRTTQIVGSFIVLNGLIAFMEKSEFFR